MPHVTRTKTATQKAIRLPEIVGLIAEILYDDAVTRGYTQANTLINFVRVNHLWYHSAVHLLWRNMGDFYGCNLHGVFLRIHPSRRGFFARFVEDAPIKLERQDNDLGRLQGLRNLDFPRLFHLVVEMTDHGSYGLPRLGKHVVREVSVVHRGALAAKVRMTPTVIDQCLATFPLLQVIRFRYPYPQGPNNMDTRNAMQRLKDAGFERITDPEIPYFWTAFGRTPRHNS